MFKQHTFVKESVEYAVLHGITYTRAVEKLFDLEPLKELNYQGNVGELNRLHSHLLWLGLFADGFGFESLFMNAGSIEKEYRMQRKNL